MLAQPFRHLIINLAVADRGIWVDRFVSVPFLIFAIWQVVRRRRWELVLLFVPTFFSLNFYPLIKFNIPRHQTTAMPGLALALVAVAAITCSRVMLLRTGKPRLLPAQRYRQAVPALLYRRPCGLAGV